MKKTQKLHRRLGLLAICLILCCLSACDSDNADAEQTTQASTKAETTIQTDTMKPEVETKPEAAVYSEGLEFLSLEDGTCAILSIGTCTDTHLVIPPVSPEGDTVIGFVESAFEDCTQLESVVIPETITYIESDIFTNCVNLENIVLHDNLLEIYNDSFEDSAYYNNPNNWENGVLYVGKHLIDVDPSISGACSIKEGTLVIASGAFDGCESVTSVTIPNSVIRIGDHTFTGCDNLTQVSVSNGMTSIEWGMFQACGNLVQVTIPNSITEIGAWAFSGCKKLAVINFVGTTSEWEEIEKSSDWNREVPSSAVVICSDGTVSVS